MVVSLIAVFVPFISTDAQRASDAKSRWLAPQGSWTIRESLDEPYLVHNACDDPVDLPLPSLVYPSMKRCRMDSVALRVRGRPCLSGRVSFGVVLVDARSRIVIALSGNEKLDGVRYLERTQDATEILVDTLLLSGRVVPLDTLWHSLSFVLGRDSITIVFDGKEYAVLASPWRAVPEMIAGFAAQSGEVEFRGLTAYAGSEVLAAPVPRERPVHLHFGSGGLPTGGSSPTAP